ncbi:MAG: lactate dehydrogenase [Oscillospiraceae bacterium]|nr:lactate dehydrogenase [Oscillospiraceae bacterium]
MSQFFQKEGVCFCPLGGRLPAGAVPAARPFDPLVCLVDRDPARSRGIFAIHDIAELDEPEGPRVLLPAGQGAGEAAALVRNAGACVLNTAFARCFDVLRAYWSPHPKGLRVNLVGLGDVGGTVLTGLVLLGEHITEIGIYDFYEPLCRRYELELNQVLSAVDGRTPPRVVIRDPQDLFDCDVVLFTAAKGVPPVGSGVQDVRMAQYEANRALLAPYARQARAAGFAGLFCQISDPVDHLSRAFFLESSKNAAGELDFAGLLPEQIQGYGLGVMEARARYYARKRGADFTRGAVFGPHGQDLVVANDWGEGYDEALSSALTEDTVTANLAVRELGFKPYIAPGLSSAAVSVVRTLTGRWHDGAVPVGGAYLGCQSRMTMLGPEILRRPLHPALYARVQAAHRKLEDFGYGS